MPDSLQNGTILHSRILALGPVILRAESCTLWYFPVLTQPFTAPSASCSDQTFSARDKLAAGQSQQILLSIPQREGLAELGMTDPAPHSLSLSCQHSSPCMAWQVRARGNVWLFCAHQFCGHNFSVETLKGTGPTGFSVLMISIFVWVCFCA